MRRQPIKSVAELFFWAAAEFLLEDSFKQASDLIVTIAGAFDFDNKLVPKTTDLMDQLSYEKLLQLISELSISSLLVRTMAEQNGDEKVLLRIGNFLSELSLDLEKRGDQFLMLKEPQKGIELFRKSLQLDPDNFRLIRKISELTDVSSSNDNIPSGFRYREPTMAEKSEIAFYLSRKIDSLFITLGQSYAKNTGVQFSPDAAKQKGTEIFNSVKEQLKILICDKFLYCKMRKASNLQKPAVLVTTIGDIVSNVVRNAPPLAIASILIKIGLDTFCECDE